ncbi:tumor protein p53-inducible nuclear protein 2-like [Patiria miniata]|uniref:Tumor protein p53-inducible nuclear protein 2 n=1 Tax=Patiria miniata TaxID=46514 RepID=A0A914B283_PATMI|nr:tumor protein p53-inducible nuclear protein 2-like [Patiria miniata]
MLSGLAEYIFGSAATGEAEPTSAEGAGTRPSASMQLTYAEDDWVLVDVTNSPKRAKESHPSHGTPPLGIPIPPQLEESWLVTPPPCFTAGGRSPQELATSPMENLLIEHPSMSVYGPRNGGNHTTVMRARRTNQHEANASQVAKRPKPRNLRVRNAEPPRRAAAVAARLGLENPPNLAAIQEAETMQREKRGSLSRSKVERHNKAYHQQSRSGKRHYRQNVSGRHSRVTYKQC